MHQVMTVLTGSGTGSHPGAASKRPGLGSVLKIRFCNPSTFGPLVRDYVASLHSLNEVVLHAWAETHIPASRIGDWQDKLRKMGWRAAMSPSLAPSVSSAPKAGTAVMTRMHIASTNAL